MSGADVEVVEGVNAGMSGVDAEVVETALIAETAATSAFWTASWILDVTSDASCPVIFIWAKSAMRLSVEH